MRTTIHTTQEKTEKERRKIKQIRYDLYKKHFPTHKYWCKHCLEMPQHKNNYEAHLLTNKHNRNVIKYP